MTEKRVFMRFAVIGGAGFIGSYLTKRLLNDNHSVLVIDNLHTGKKENLENLENLEFYNIDIRNYQELDETLKNLDGIFHEAALTVVKDSFEKPKEYHDVNVAGTGNIFKIAKKRGIKVVYASSSSVYGNVEKIPIIEDFEKNPINPYGKTKLEDELLAEKYTLNNSEIIGLRYFNVYGKGQTGSYAGVITKFLENIRLQKPLKIHGGGNQIRDFIHVSDITKANIAAMESKIKKGFFNIGTGKGTSINDLAKLMIQISEHKDGIIHTEPLEGDIEISQPEMSLTNEVFDWRYEVELKDGLTKMINNLEFNL